MHVLMIIILVIIYTQIWSRAPHLKKVYLMPDNFVVGPIGETPKLRLINSFSKEKVRDEKIYSLRKFSCQGIKTRTSLHGICVGPLSMITLTWVMQGIMKLLTLF